MSEPIDRIVARVLASPKYRNVCEYTVRRIASEEYGKRSTLKQAIKATKARLHQVYGAYEVKVAYDRAYQSLENAYQSGEPGSVRQVCQRLLSLHVSTRERLPILDRFYAEIFAHTGVPHAVLDLACGLNPLALPWMGLDDSIAYYAYDIDLSRVAFLNRYFALVGIEPRARGQDVICDPPAERADVALLLKSSACLERQRENSTLALLDALDVSWVVVSFPVKSLGNREKGMLQHYTRRFTDMVSGRPWPITPLVFDTELVFVLCKEDWT